MRLLAWPRGASSAALGPGERVRSRIRGSSWTLALRGRLTRTYRLEAALGASGRALRPCALRVRGRVLRRRFWSFDRTTRVLRATFRMRSGTLSVQGRCRAARRG